MNDDKNVLLLSVMCGATHTHTHTHTQTQT